MKRLTLIMAMFALVAIAGCKKEEKPAEPEKPAVEAPAEKPADAPAEPVEAPAEPAEE